MDKKSYIKKFLSILMAVTVAVTFVPLLGDNVFADESQDAAAPEIEVELDDADELIDDIAVEGEEDKGSVVEGEEDKGSVVEGEEPEADVVEEVPIVNSEGDDADAEPEGSISTKMQAKGVVKTQAVPYSGKVTVDPSDRNTIYVTGSFPSPYHPGRLMVDTYEQSVSYSTSVSGGTTKLRATIHLYNYDTKYHTIGIQVLDSTNQVVDILAQGNVYGNHFTKPNDKGRFVVYAKYLNYYPFVNQCNYAILHDKSDYHIYLEIKTGKGKWKRWDLVQYDYITTASDIGSKINKLKPSTRYKTRIRYGKYINGAFYGGPVRNTGTYKTGKTKKLKIKKITAKAVNVKYHKEYRPGYYYYTGYSYVWIKGTTMKYYTYNVKVTVKLKKKPGTKGIFVNGKFLKGNKKKYTTKFKIPSPHNMSVKKPRGHIKYKVTVRSGQSKSYGGYSPSRSKKKTLS